MPTLIKDRRIVPDSWRLLSADATTVNSPCAADVIVPLTLWRAASVELAARPGRVGVWLEPNEGPETIAADLARLPLVAVEFPKFTDGRGFSTASLLRSRYGYRGEIRAIGDVLRDQLLYLRRCGFDAFALREDQDAEAALGAFDDLPPGYQSAVDEPLPLFRRRLAGAPA